MPQASEAFADHLCVPVRTVAYRRKRPDMVPQAAMQDLLDATLDKAPDRIKAQSCLACTRSLHIPEYRSGHTDDPYRVMHGSWTVARRPTDNHQARRDLGDGSVHSAASSRAALQYCRDARRQSEIKPNSWTTQCCAPACKVAVKRTPHIPLLYFWERQQRQ